MSAQVNFMYLPSDKAIKSDSGDVSNEDVQSKMDEQAQIATLQASVQQLYATLQDYANKCSVLYEENKALKEQNSQNSSQPSATETNGSVVEEATEVSFAQPNLQQSAARPEPHTAEPTVAIAEANNQQPTAQGTIQYLNMSGNIVFVNCQNGFR